MPRHRPPDAAPAPPPMPHVVHPTAVYGVDDARVLLRLKASTVRREVRQGRLRISKRAGRYYVLGEWLLEWIRGGELPRWNVNREDEHADIIGTRCAG